MSRPCTPVPPRLAAKIIDAAKAGASLATLARATGLDERVVRRFLCERGIALRPRRKICP